MIDFRDPVFWLLCAMAVAALAMFFGRLVELRRSQVDWQDFLKGVINVLSGGNENEALAICADTPVPVANVAACAIRHRKGSIHALREAVDAQGRAEAGRLERRIAASSVIGHIAPLIGLLGTFAGFVKVVAAVSQHDIVPRTELIMPALSAMVDAAAGVAVAIPVAVMYATLRLKMDRLVTELEAAATEIVGYVMSRESRA